MRPIGGAPTNPYQQDLDQLTVAFTASTSTIFLCISTESVQFSWRVSPSDLDDPPFRFTLQVGTQSFSVGPAGSRSVQISGPVSYMFYVEFVDDEGNVLGARTLKIGSIIASSQAAPGYNANPIPVTNQQVAQALPGDLGALLGKYDMSLRSAPGVVIDPSGIHIGLSLNLPTDVDLIDVAVNMTAVPVLNDSQLSVILSYFNIQANFPWWVYAINPPEVAAVNEFLNAVLIPELQPGIANTVLQTLNSSVQAEAAGATIFQVQLLYGSVQLIVCTLVTPRPPVRKPPVLPVLKARPAGKVTRKKR